MIISEGNIFVLIFKKNKIMAQARLDDGTGKVFFPTTKYQISKYLYSEINLDTLLQKSPADKVEFYDHTKNTTSIIDKTLVGKLSCGQALYNDFPRDMIMSFPKRVELAVQVNPEYLDYKKIMEYVRQYFYIKEKYEVIVLIYGDKCPISERYYRQLMDLNHLLHDFEIPIDYVHHTDIVAMEIEKACLEKDFGLSLHKIAKKDFFRLSNIETNYLAYRLSNLIADLKIYPKFWSKKTKLLYLKDYGDHYFQYTRNIVIDDVLE